MNSSTTTTTATTLIRPEEVAKRLAISKRTLWRMVAAGALPQPVRFSSQTIRFREADIEDYIRSRHAKN